MLYPQFYGFMVARCGRQAVELLTVPADGRPNNGAS
jgi:hypothetical protein